MRKTDANSSLLEHFSGTFRQDKARVTEELQMCASGLALGPGSPNSHLHLGPVGYVLSSFQHICSESRFIFIG